MADIKQQIQEFISEGRTEDALGKLAHLTTDAVLLQSRFQNAKRQFHMGMIGFEEWGRLVAQINYAALEMANKEAPVTQAPKEIEVPGQPALPAQPVPPPVAPAVPPTGPRVFISYSHLDHLFMRSVKGYLLEHGIQTYVDLNDISVGASIQGFINEALKNNDFVLSIVSRNSLLSGWVSQELTVVQVLHQYKDNWIPVSIDDAIFNNDFYFEALEKIDKRIEEIVDSMKAALNSKGVDIRPFTDDMNRQQDLRSNLGKTISTLKGMFVVDISGKLFDDGMGKVVKHIRKRQTT